MKKINEVLIKIFAIGILLCLLAGGISVIGYLIAVIIGGENATLMCAFIFKKYLPIVIKTTSVFAGIGLISMYIGRENHLRYK